MKTPSSIGWQPTKGRSRFICPRRAAGRWECSFIKQPVVLLFLDTDYQCHSIHLHIIAVADKERAGSYANTILFVVPDLCYRHGQIMRFIAEVSYILHHCNLCLLFMLLANTVCQRLARLPFTSVNLSFYLRRGDWRCGKAISC